MSAVHDGVREQLQARFVEGPAHAKAFHSLGRTLNERLLCNGQSCEDLQWSKLKGGRGGQRFTLENRRSRSDLERGEQSEHFRRHRQGKVNEANETSWLNQSKVYQRSWHVDVEAVFEAARMPHA